MNLNIIKIQKITEVYGAISKLKIGVVTITLILLVMAVLLFIIVSNRIYRPIGKLVKMISSDKNHALDEHGKNDEIVYLNDFYRSSMEKLELYHRDKSRNKDIIKHYWLNLLLLESHKLDAQQTEQIFEEDKICLLPDNGFIVCVMKIDHYRNFMQRQSTKERDLLRFAIVNITSEIIHKQYKNECIDMKEDHLAIIISVPESDENYEQSLKTLINEAQERISEYFRLSVSVSASKKTMDIRELSSLYGKVVDNMAYRLVLGHSCVIFQENFQKSDNNSNSITLNEEEALINEKIKTGDLEDMEVILKKAFQKISSMHYDHILFSLISLARLINNTLESQKAFLTMNVHFDFNYICQSIMEKETLEEIYDVFIERLGIIQENGEEIPAQSKNSYIISAVKDYIYKNYDNKSLSLTSISDFMNISPRRLSKIFKEEMQMAVSDYITDVRLDKAAELLEQSALNVNEVIATLGIKNETYFYVLFKKKFGLTPKEYSFKRIVKMSQE